MSSPPPVVTPTILDRLVPAVPAQHIPGECTCRACGDSSYRDLLARCDYQRREMSRLSAEVAELRSSLIRETHARLTAEMTLAIDRGDREAWAKAMAQREHAPEWLQTLRLAGAL